MTRALAVTKRVLRGFGRDKRTIGLMLVAPCLVLSLIWLIFDSSQYTPKIAAVDLNERILEALDEQDADVRVLDADAAVAAIGAGEVDAVVSLEGARLAVQVEGSDPTRTSEVVAVLANVGSSLGPAGFGLARPMGPKVQRLHGDDDMSLFDNFGPVLLGFLVFFFTFVVSGVTFVQERRSGTLERMLTTPLRRHELVLGYALGFAAVVFVQVCLASVVSIYLLGMMLEGSFVWLLATVLLLAGTALALGMFVSAFARSEFQVFQFIPVVIIPQIFFSGLFPLDGMVPWLQRVGEVLPLTYGANALRDVMIRGAGLDVIWTDLVVLVGFMVLALGANVLALKQYRKL